MYLSSYLSARKYGVSGTDLRDCRDLYNYNLGSSVAMSEVSGHARLQHDYPSSVHTVS